MQRVIAKAARLIADRLRIEGDRVHVALVYRPFQGFSKTMPQWLKSPVLRVATAAPRERAMAAT